MPFPSNLRHLVPEPHERRLFTLSAKTSAIGKVLVVQGGAWQSINQGGKCVLGEERKCDE
ncbi:hypothetical protein WK68_34630 [Burkholderia ubonensis]|nr:hypothetical protein WK68_34630 [Burkholderia ubonensis]